MSSIQYRPEVDGLRALAVIPVILFHMGFTWIKGGYLGVDVFFVISGYLITSIVYKEIQTGTFTFWGFWKRRIRRILPALTFVVLSTLAFARIFAFRGEMPGLGQQAMSALASIANFFYWRTAGNYWGTQAEDSLLLHTWSLSVEEQYYLFFPIIFWLIASHRRTWLINAALLVIIVSFGSFLWGATYFSNATFYLLPTRAWELAAGSFLALTYSPERSQSGISSGLAMSGIGLVCLSYGFVDELNGESMLAVLGTGLVILFADTGLAKKVLGSWPLVSIGKISYSLYLWHWPVIVFGRQLNLFGGRVEQLVLMVALATISYFLVEQTFRRSRSSVGLILAGFAATLAVSWYFSEADSEYDTQGFHIPANYALYYDVSPRGTSPRPFAHLKKSVTTPRREIPAKAYLECGIRSGPSGETPRLVVLGDSHGIMWSHTINRISDEMNLPATFCSIRGVPPFVRIPLHRQQKTRFLSAREKFEYDRTRLELIESWNPQVVFICARWAIYDVEEVSDLLEFLEDHAVNVVLVEQPPELDIGDRNALQYLCYRGFGPMDGQQVTLPQGNVDKVMRGRQMLDALSIRFRNCTVLKTYEKFARDGQTLCLDGRDVLYYDDDHLSDLGAERCASDIRAILAAAFDGKTP